MATEVAALAPPLADIEENSVAEEAASAAAKNSGPHKLERKWTFWFDNQSKPKQSGAAWGSSLKKAYTFETVQEFWWYA